MVIFQSVSDAYDGWVNTKPEQRRMAFASASHMTLKSEKNKMKPTNPNAHTYVYGTDVKTHGYAVTHNTFLQ